MYDIKLLKFADKSFRACLIGKFKQALKTTLLLNLCSSDCSYGEKPYFRIRNFMG